ncbi:carbon catabolite repressor protein 4 homolog 4 [Selaginella moellendorffii]|uniref:carbon catabolite repressor protein 4 homolog 4 n=1 Tax=Selaginella moellendorffii TaxID=88036 RepID=UPI000D1C3906|nr:carbon catabolite repressor protein 4 homolog 4 [Selaginella moellendorffii]|eukprot:XP_024526877.1 carbon catabolite repressor protein 4 homolog 4 [Selaginella moellendorffii]
MLALGSRFLRPGLRLQRGSSPQHRHCIATAASMVSKPFVWTPNFIPVEHDDNSEFPETGSFRVVSYNILAQVYVKSSLFPHSPSLCLKWKTRSEQVLSRLLSLDADLLCLQELDEFESFYKPLLESRGYSSIYVQRSGKKRDGCGIIYKAKWCQLLKQQFLDYNDIAPDETTAGRTSESVEEENDRDVSDPRVRFRRNCVGIFSAFRFHHAPSNIVVIANTHLYWDPALQDVKLAQAKYLLAKLLQFEKEISQEFNSNPVVLVAGDFNSTPGDRVYNYITSGRRNSGPDIELSSFKVPDLESLKVPAIPLDSLYAAAQGEPAFTNCTPDFTGTLDYIFFSPSASMRPKTILEVPRPDAPDVKGGLPNHFHPSDHLPIGADFSLS